MKEQVIDHQITKTYKEQRFELDINNDATLGRLFQSLIMIYSDKFSFIREFVQNAYDAVVEMWENKYTSTIDLNTFLINNPIVVSLYEDAIGQYIEIKETEGIGMSEDRIDNMFRFVTKSSKRDSLFQIGAKGIGKLAALAYTDCYYITTNHEGKCYEYKISWYSQAGVPKITEPIISNTSEKNGTTVKIYIVRERDIDLLQRSILNFLSYFNNIFYNNLYVNARSSSSNYEYRYKADTANIDNWKFNNSKVDISLNKIPLHNFDTFLYRKNVEIFNRELFLIVDRIPYSIDWQMINEEKIYFPFGLKVSSEYILLNDNRDSIRYTDDVIIHIKEKLRAFEAEMLGFITKGLCNKVDNFKTTLTTNCKFHISTDDKYQFLLTSNPLASWSKSYHLIEKLVYNVRNSELRNLFEIDSIKRKDKIIKKFNSNSSIIYEFNKYFTRDNLDFDVFINDIPTTKLTAGMINSQWCYILKNPDIDSLDLRVYSIYDLNSQKIVKDEIKKFFETIPKLSDNINVVTKNKLVKAKHEIKVVTINKRYGGKYEKTSEMLDINTISDEYVILQDTDLNNAYRVREFMDNFYINKIVAIVAPTYYSKIKYNLSYFLYNSEYVKTINTFYLICEKYPLITGLMKLYNQMFIFDYSSFFKDTIIYTLLNEISDYPNLKELLKDSYIKHKTASLVNVGLFVDDTYVNIDITEKLKTLYNIFYSDYSELLVIDYNTNNDKKLINELIKIILNKNNTDEKCL